MRVLFAVVGIVLDAFPKHQKEKLLHLKDKILLFFGINLNINALSCVFAAKPFLFPGFEIPAVTTSTISFFYNNFMPFMIGILEAFDTLYAGTVSGTIVALSD